MEPPKPQSDRQSYWRKIVWFGCLCTLGLFCLAGVALYFEIAPFLYQQQWSGNIQRGIEIWKGDSEQGKAYIEKVMTEARAANLPPASLIGLYRDYAKFLYSEDEKEQGDQQIAAAVALCKVLPTTGSLEADQLIHAYQDRAWDSHRRFLVDPSKSPGDKDQELSVSIAEHSFGLEHEQTIYKIPTLALIYADLGYKDKAEKMIQRALTVSDTSPGARECAWFAYAMLARIRAVQHDYKAATVAYLHAIDLAKDQRERSRIWDEFSTGLKQGQPQESTVGAKTKSLFAKDKFAELDQLAGQLVAKQTSTAKGFWDLDYLMGAVEGERGLNESTLRQRIYDLNHWLSKSPHSAHARVALAQTYIYAAWDVRNREDGNKIKNGKLFLEYIEKARSALKDDKSLLKQTPAAYVAFARLAVADGDREKYFKLLNECHVKWPNYFCIDTWALRFALPQFFGQPNDVEKYVISRSDQISGKKGDEEYARLVWSNEGMMAPIFVRGSLIKWKRVREGLKQIFKDYPHDMEARIAFIEFTFQTSEQDSIDDVFEGFQSSVPPVASIQP